MSMTVSYFEVGGLIADLYADPLCQLLAAEGEENEAEALFSVEIAYWVHVTVCPSND